MHNFSTHETNLHPEYNKTLKLTKDENPLNDYIRNKPRAESLPIINKGYESQEAKMNIVIPSKLREREAVIPIVGLKYRSYTLDIPRYGSLSPKSEPSEKDSGDFYPDELRNSDRGSGKSEENVNIRIPGVASDEKLAIGTNLEMILNTKCVMTPEERLLEVLGNPELSTSNRPQSIWSRFGRSDNRRREKELYSLGYNKARQVFETYSKIRAENSKLNMNINSLEENLKYRREQKISLKQDIVDLRRNVKYNQINEENNRHIIKYDNYTYQLKVMSEENEYLSDCLNSEKQVYQYKLEEASERAERYYMKLEDLRSSIVSNMTERISLQSASSDYTRILNRIQYYRGLISLTNSSISLASEMFTEAQSHFQMSKEQNESKMSVISVLKSLQEEVDLTLQADTEFKKASSTDPKAIMPFTRSSNISALTPRMLHKRIGI
jgi:hypothetical protein